MIKTRFAPSPTGHLHIGNIRIAIINYMFARSHNGEFWLRLDDTDTDRCSEEFANGINTDLAWMGLKIDGTFRQSERFPRYVEVLEQLKKIGRVYPCFETTEQLALKRNLQIAQGKPPVYDRESLQLTDTQIQQKRDSGIKPHWRFLLQDTPIQWQDMSQGDVHFESGHLSDPVLVRADGRPLFTFTTVVDDMDTHITHIIRGEDHTTNTAVQVQIFTALEADIPTFAHMPLVGNADGDKFSKRTGTGAIATLRSDGIEPISIMACMTRLGTPKNAESTDNMESLIGDFDINAYGRASLTFSADDVYTLNTKILHHLPYEAVKDRLPRTITPDIWAILSGNLNTLDDIKLWEQVIFNTVKTVIKDTDFIATALSLLPDGDITDTTWKQWTDAIKDATGRTGKQLFLPLRLAITGQPHGPEMGKILPFIGREKVLNRMS